MQNLQPMHEMQAMEDTPRPHPYACSECPSFASFMPYRMTVANLPAGLMLSLLCLAGCAPEVGDDLRTWATTVRKQALEPNGDAPAITMPSAFTYDPAGRRDPFDASRLSVDLADADTALRPEAGRQREALEVYPLDSLKMVGSMRREGKAIALVQADHLLHQVRVGDHLGQDFGQVTAISEQAITIAERIQDGSGKWQLRRAQLPMRQAGTQ